MKCAVAQTSLKRAVYSSANLDTVLDLIKQNVTDIESQKKAVIEVWDNTTDIAGLFYETTVDHYNKYIDVKGQAASSSNTVMAIIDMSYKLGDLLVTKFDNNTFKDEIINAWRQGVDYTIASSKLFLAANVQLRALMNGTAEDGRVVVSLHHLRICL